ncbi:MAG: hypothetical protein LBK93_04190 [Rickettsiales bacterium]|jgi:hypothetical protein|nr:hypothetical protein [Rickettsiales bacterium]
MVKRVFISGSINSKSVPEVIINQINTEIRGGAEFIVGDASGIDTAVQEYLKSQNYNRVRVFTVYGVPRNMVDKRWQFVRVDVDHSNKKLFKDGKYTRSAQLLKDAEMAKIADIGIVLWSPIRKNRWGKKEISKGSLNNIVNLLSGNKPVRLLFLPEASKGLATFDEKDDFSRWFRSEFSQDIYYEHTKNNKRKNSMLDYYEEINEGPLPIIEFTQER